MTQTPHQFINSPGSGNQVWTSLWDGCIAAGGDSITVTVRFWTGANGSGSLIAVTTAQVWVWDFDTGSSVSTSTGSGVNTLSRLTGLATAGHRIQCSGKFTGAQSVGSIELYMDYTSSSAYVPNTPSFSPSVGAPGTSVTITGSHFTDATYVQFNGTNASYTINSDTQITATVPSGATAGPITVGNPAGSASSSGSFEPGIIYGDHLSGAPVNLVAIYGSHTAGAPVRVLGVYRGPAGGGAPIRIW